MQHHRTAACTGLLLDGIEQPFENLLLAGCRCKLFAQFVQRNQGPQTSIFLLQSVSFQRLMHHPASMRRIDRQLDQTGKTRFQCAMQYDCINSGGKQDADKPRVLQTQFGKKTAAINLGLIVHNQDQADLLVSTKHSH